MRFICAISERWLAMIFWHSSLMSAPLIGAFWHLEDRACMMPEIIDFRNCVSATARPSI